MKELGILVTAHWGYAAFDWTNSNQVATFRYQRLNEHWDIFLQQSHASQGEIERTTEVTEKRQLRIG